MHTFGFVPLICTQGPQPDANKRTLAKQRLDGLSVEAHTTSVVTRSVLPAHDEKHHVHYEED